MLKFLKKKAKPEAGSETEAPAEAAEAAEGAEGEAGAKKKKLPLFAVIGAAAVLVLGGGGAGAWFLFMKPSAGAESPPAAQPPAKKKGGGGHGSGGGSGGSGGAGQGQIREGPDGVTFLTLPDLIVNIQSPDGRPTFLKLKLTLEMGDPELAHALMAESPRLQDMFQGFLRELRPEDLAGSAGSHQLRQEILRRVNLIAAPEHVDAVLIEEMLVQ